MKDVIILKKTREKEMLSEIITNTTAPAKVAQVLSSVEFAKRYNRAISVTDLDAVKILGLTSIKKYWKRVGMLK